MPVTMRLAESSRAVVCGRGAAEGLNGTVLDELVLDESASNRTVLDGTDRLRRGRLFFWGRWLGADRVGRGEVDDGKAIDVNLRIQRFGGGGSRSNAFLLWGKASRMQRPSLDGKTQGLAAKQRN